MLQFLFETNRNELSNSMEFSLKEEHCNMKLLQCERQDKIFDVVLDL